METDLRAADLQELIALVYADWESIDPRAANYLRAVAANDCHELDDPVGNETADLQLRYFLSNAAGWRGPAARAVKGELRRRLGL